MEGSLKNVVIGLADRAYGRVDYESEADLEDAIIKVQHRLCRSNRFYLDVKNKIGTKGCDLTDLLYQVDC
jgi:hypothetical protein